LTQPFPFSFFLAFNPHFCLSKKIALKCAIRRLHRECSLFKMPVMLVASKPSPVIEASNQQGMLAIQIQASGKAGIAEPPSSAPFLLNN